MPKSETLSQFYTAARQGDFAQLERLADQDPELVVTADPKCFNYHLLNYGAWQNRRDYIDLALSHGAPIDQPSEFWAGDWTALQHAINYGHLEIAEYLVERGAQVDLHSAAGLPRLGALREMLARDSNLVNQRGGDGTTPLHFAASHEVVDLLLDHGADIDARDVDHDSTPAQWAANNRPQVALHLVSRGAEPDIFMLVAALDRNRISQFLADNPGALFERISTVRFPPPAEHPDVRCIYFFTPSMGPNATPLHVAAVKNSVQVVDLLIEAGLGVDTRGGYDEATPLHLAAWNGSIQAARRLLELGAEIDARSGKLHNNTPLGWAIVSGSVASVQFLLEQGARVFDFHPKEAATGVAGRFREYSQASIEDWKVIQELLSQQSGAR